MSSVRDLEDKVERNGAAGNRRAKLGSGKAKVGSSMDRELEQKLREFVMFKTVSSDRSLREDCYRGAKYLCKLLTEVLGKFLPVSKNATLFSAAKSQLAGLNENLGNIST